jgi:hypothetical protein
MEDPAHVGMRGVSVDFFPTISSSPNLNC